jgi:fructose-bisphosphate aldolase class II
VAKTCGEAARFYLVSHGGSGSTQEKIDEALDYGVVKMNVDNDMQYAFTRAVAGQMFKNDHCVLQVDGEVGNKELWSAVISCWYFGSAQARSQYF